MPDAVGRVVELKEQIDIIVARGAGRETARQLGFGSADQTRLATAISEVARNALQYAGEGRCLIRDESDQDRIRIKVVIQDRGPGISDIEQAMQDGFSTSGGLGAGLPGARRLVHEFSVESEPGLTRVSLMMSRPR